MTLNYEGRKELREKIEKIIISVVSDGEKIDLNEVFSDIKDKLGVEDLYDYLLFETFSNKKKLFKVPIWSGEFLRKIDLSNVNFEDVAWTTSSIVVEDIFGDFIADDICGEYRERKKQVDYSYTNAVIDFSKSFEAKTSRSGLPSIERCNFAGLDFSNFDISDFNYIGTDLSNTGIRIGSFDKYSPDDFLDINFSNLDMSRACVNAYEIAYSNCICTNTGLNIQFSIDDFILDCTNNGNMYFDELKDFRTQLKKGYYDGCYINGKKINTQYTKKQKAKEYEQFKQAFFDSVSDSITKINVKKK